MGRIDKVYHHFPRLKGFGKAKESAMMGSLKNNDDEGHPGMDALLCCLTPQTICSPPA